MVRLVFYCSDVFSCYRLTGHYVRDNYSVLLNMAHVYYIVTIRVIWTSWAHVWRFRFCFFRTEYDSRAIILWDAWTCINARAPCVPLPTGPFTILFSHFIKPSQKLIKSWSDPTLNIASSFSSARYHPYPRIALVVHHNSKVDLYFFEDQKYFLQYMKITILTIRIDRGSRLMLKDIGISISCAV
jgi:hypothetical protein